VIPQSIVIRPERASDINAIYGVNTLAFGQPAEGDLVDALREANGLSLSLVAECDGKVAGHIAFSPAAIETANGTLDAIGLAPMSVRPELQRSGIGSQLVREGLARIQVAGHRYVIVLGHKDYYPRFGFVVAANHGLRSEYDVPPEHFMVQGLNGAPLDGIAGLAKYHPAFNDL
jgi:putative acetyltransferase